MAFHPPRQRQLQQDGLDHPRCQARRPHQFIDVDRRRPQGLHDGRHLGLAGGHGPTWGRRSHGGRFGLERAQRHLEAPQLRADRLQHVIGAERDRGAVLEQHVRPLGARIEGMARHCEDVAALLGGRARGDQCP